MSGPASDSRSSGETSLYAEWNTINASELCETNSKSVLYKLRTAINGQGVVDAVVRSLVVGLNVGTGGSNVTSSSVDGHHASSSISSTSSLSSYQKPQSVDYLQSDRDVQWVMEVICYGLSLPIFTNEQHEGLRDCVHIYCEWMFCILPSKSRDKRIPNPIREDPNVYFQLMIHHLYNVFIRRPQNPSAINNSPLNAASSSSSNGRLPSANVSDFNISDVTSKQAVLCHGILTKLESICADEGNILDADSWESVLTFLLAINETLLSGPVDKDDIGSNLCERIVKSLFEIWVTACHRSFPSPSYWKTLNELCLKIRHRIPVIDYWSLTCLSITQRLVQMTSPTSSTSSANESTSTLTVTPNQFSVLNHMSYEVASQAWYRFLHIIGNPVDIFTNASDEGRPSSVAISSPDFSASNHRSTDSSVILGENFRRAIKGIASIVATFLGASPLDIVNVHPAVSSTGHNLSSTPSVSPVVVSPSIHRRSSGPSKTADKSKPLAFLSTVAGKGSSSTNLQQQQQHQQQQQQQQQTQQQTQQQQHQQSSGHSHQLQHQHSLQEKSINQTSGQHPNISLPSNIPLNINQVPSFKLSPFRPKINLILNTFSKWLFKAALAGTNLTSATLSDNESFDADSFSSRRSSISSYPSTSSVSTLTNWSHASPIEIGQAEAIGTLCRLFSSKRTDEDISPTYLARFYLTIQHGLSFREPVKPAILTSILLNSTRLFQQDLNGVNILIPHYLRALEWVTSDHRNGSSQIELRRACIAILLSLLPYPLHFNRLPIKDCLTETSNVTTFQSLRPKLTQVLITALRTETDSINAQHLLVGLFTCIESFVNFEKEFPSQSNDGKSHANHPPPSPKSSNLSELSETSAASRESIPDTSHGLFVRVLHLVCHNLISNWRNDTQFSLTALEVLSGLARIHLTPDDGPLIPVIKIEFQKTVKWICEYIVTQCSRPPPSHSRDMHSTIVAAYQSLTVWFQEHPDILSDHTTVKFVFEVIELGISGSKSRSSSGIIFKSQKQLKPASKRVREAAESLLSCLMNHIGSSSLPCCSTITDTMLVDEVTLLKHLSHGYTSSAERAVQEFRYFIKDSSILLAIVKNNEQTNVDRLNRTGIIIRSAFGKYCWLLDNQLTLPSQVSSSPFKIENVPRPLPAPQSVSRFTCSPRWFPEFIGKIPMTKLDMVVPSLESVVAATPNMLNEHKKLRDNLERQCKIEKQAQSKMEIKSRPCECKEPLPVSRFEPVRLILSHFGFLDESSITNNNSQIEGAIVPLDYDHRELWPHLKSLDLISTRTSDTVFVFYMRKGRSDPQEILNSVSSKHYVTQVFLDFLQSLGSVIDVKRHRGWTGNVESSWKIDDSSSTSSELGDPGYDHGGCVYDGIRKAIYWSDVSHELVFVVPSGRYSDEDTFSITDEPRVRSSNFEALSQGGRSMSSDEGTSVSSRNYSESGSRTSLRNRSKQPSISSNIGCDTKLLVIWLESADDLAVFPIDCLINTTKTGVESDSVKEYFALFIHPLKNGLFRINTSTNRAPMTNSVPLVDGSVVDRGLLGPFVRMTVLNYCQRRRLASDNYQPSHTKRRLKIQEMAKKFQIQLSNQEDFLASIFF